MHIKRRESPFKGPERTESERDERHFDNFGGMSVFVFVYTAKQRIVDFYLVPLYTVSGTNTKTAPTSFCELSKLV